MMWPPITRDDLKIAAKRTGFDQMLPVLIRRLIAETADGLRELDMPGESGVASGGFDGIVTTERETTFVPAGSSVWELSVGGNDAKANEDYAKRTVGPPGREPSECTYVELILAPWTKSRVWASAKSKDLRWSEVRAYNVDSVHTWLEMAPATTVWLAEQLGKLLAGVRSVQDWWEETWLPSTEVPLGANIVLSGRTDSSRKLVDQLSTGPMLISLGGNLRLDEAMAFVAAVLSDSNNSQINQLYARALLVEDRNSLLQLVAQQSPLLIVLSDPRMARDLPATHPHRIITLAHPGDETAILVERLDSDLVAAALGDDEQARELGYLARRSLLSLRRRLAVNPSILTPIWADNPDQVTRRLSLAGSWHADHEGDRTVVENLVGESYSKVRSRAEILRTGPDLPLVDHVQDEWYVVARDDTWSLISPSLDADDVRSFQRVALEVLTVPNPVLNLSPDERWKAGLKGIHPTHTASIRRGLAETIALMGANSQVVRGVTVKESDYARQMMRQIADIANKDESYRTWISLSDVLSLLAEAAPIEFLAAMRDGLEGDAPLHRLMFAGADTRTSLFSETSPHVYFLWALERIAWSSDHIDEVVRVLIRLQDLDPGGETNNRPTASLLGILSVWCPQTSASTADRKRCLRLISSASERGFETLLALIPESRPMQMSHPGPEFRDWRKVEHPTRGQIDEVTNQIAEMLLKEFELTAPRALQLIPRLDDFGSEFRDSFVNSASVAAAHWTSNDRADVYDALREFVARHSEYADTEWALSPEALEPISILRDRVEPMEPDLKYRWLFTEDWLTLGDLSRRDSHEVYESMITRHRRQAVAEVLEWGGLVGVLKLAEGVESRIVGQALGSLQSDVGVQLLDSLAGGVTAVSVAAGYFSVYLTREDVSIDQLLESFSAPEQQAFILRHFQDQEAAIAKLASVSEAVAELFWKHFSIYGLGKDFAMAVMAGRCLIDVGRPVAAIKLNLLYERESASDQNIADLFASALEHILEMREPDPEFITLRGRRIERVFSVLSEFRENLGSQRVISLEWQLLPLSGFNSSAPSLHAEIKANPDFFVGLIVTGFRSKTDDFDVDQPAEDEGFSDGGEGLRKVNSVRAWEVLRSCRQVPGVEGKEMNIDVTKDWIERARRSLVSADRIELGDIHIGSLLSHSPRNEDGSPIPTELRSLLEELSSAEITRGIVIGLFNSRGVVNRSLSEGGSQELAIAASYRDYAEGARDYPRTRGVFESVAENYESFARREDLAAERWKQGLS
ncbi:hypothetical protein [Lysinibacter cavernae]|uniref:Uncharacterized protein n=1 Tax=Lysinibacter cavernae TaxID=1640652 RepID=A0A7X5R2X9_9MICO|nr:hypothetical protein [Lysinibacter cavernae]NIH54688.1 hypothetical protein [Lysinibacter cavernae]